MMGDVLKTRVQGSILQNLFCFRGIEYVFRFLQLIVAGQAAA